MLFDNVQCFFLFSRFRCLLNGRFVSMRAKLYYERFPLMYCVRCTESISRKRDITFTYVFSPSFTASSSSHGDVRLS